MSINSSSGNATCLSVITSSGSAMLCPVQAAKTLLDLQQEHEGLRRKHVMQASATPACWPHTMLTHGWSLHMWSRAAMPDDSPAAETAAAGMQGHQLEQQKGEMEARRAAASKEHSERLKVSRLKFSPGRSVSCSIWARLHSRWQPVLQLTEQLLPLGSHALGYPQRLCC